MPIAALLLLLGQPETWRSEEVVIPANGHQLAGTLYLPSAGPPAPGVVFVHGAGPAVRGDGYHELGRHFARKGVAALIYDKRGCGESTGDWTKAGLHDLADDALACFRWLRQRPGINPAQVGLWGLSEGASVIPLAAGRSPEVAFIIAVGGCLDFEEQMCYYRANLFRRQRLPRAALDIANKTFLFQVDLSNRIRAGWLPAPQWVRDTCRFEFDLDQPAAWRQVRQPILAIYGERDQMVLVAQSSAALAEAAAQSGNRSFTLVIYPGASHSLGKTRTGELGEEWTGYVPEYLDDMTDWVLEQASGTKRPGGWPQRGQAPEVEQPFSAERYDRLRWYGNALAQAFQFLVFAAVFLVGAGGGIIGLIRGWHRDDNPAIASARKWLAGMATALSLFNLALLAGLVVLARGLADQLRPSYIAALGWLPLLGSLSAGLALALLVLLVVRWPALPDSWLMRARWGLFMACALASVPFLLYWNLLGLAWN